MVCRTLRMALLVGAVTAAVVAPARASHKAPYRANQFGGSLGGPIIKNKTFFFVDYQALLLRNGISYILTVPTEAMKQGTFLKSQFPGPIYDPATNRSDGAGGFTRGEHVHLGHHIGGSKSIPSVGALGQAGT